MFLMLDICVNNMAWAGPPQSVNYGDLSPLNKQEYFHPYCPIDYTNRTSTLDVRPPAVFIVDQLVLDGRQYCCLTRYQHREL